VAPKSIFAPSLLRLGSVIFATHIRRIRLVDSVQFAQQRRGKSNFRRIPQVLGYEKGRLLALAVIGAVLMAFDGSLSAAEIVPATVICITVT
jgi:hypothetical protein